MQKKCRNCGDLKDVENFYTRNPVCKSCVSEIKKISRVNNPIVTEFINPQEGEVWIQMKGREKYHRISSFGRISSLCNSVRKIARPMRQEKVLKQHLNSHTGYYSYTFKWVKENGKAKRDNIHRLVALHFIPNPNDLAEVNHKDGDKTNNRVENLEWVSREQNIQHGFTNGLIKVLKGENAHNCTLTNEQVLFIYNSEIGPRQLSRDLKMPYSKIASIKNGVSWSHITGATKKYYGKEKDKPRYTN